MVQVPLAGSGRHGRALAGGTLAVALAAAAPPLAIDFGLGMATTDREQRWVPRPSDGDESGTAQPDAGAVETNPFWIFGDGFESSAAYAWSWSPP